MNIIILSDGTGQDGRKTEHVSNIYKIDLMAEKDETNQYVYYDPGVGTDFRPFTGQIAGRGLSKNLKKCYEQIAGQYAGEQDNIFLFGFSRGAATVRSLSAFVHAFGLLAPGQFKHINDAFKIYQIENPAQRKEHADAFAARHNTRRVRIAFLGCFDTVAALGLPNAFGSIINLLPWWKHRFHDFRLNNGVDYACHALALDERRRVFAPLLWEPETKPGQTMRQVWFCGDHSDIGGGYPEAGLSDITLQWMLQHAATQGLLLKEPSPVKLFPDVNDILHKQTFALKIIPWLPRTRSWPKERPDRPVIHPTVTKRAKNARNEEKPYHSWIFDIPHDQSS